MRRRYLHGTHGKHTNQKTPQATMPCTSMFQHDRHTVQTVVVELVRPLKYFPQKRTARTSTDITANGILLVVARSCLQPQQRTELLDVAPTHGCPRPVPSPSAPTFVFFTAEVGPHERHAQPNPTLQQKQNKVSFDKTISQKPTFRHSRLWPEPSEQPSSPRGTWPYKPDVNKREA